MRFAKYHGTGNDFVMVEDLEDALRLEEAVIAALCDRHRGVGADGLIRIVDGGEADFFMDYYNANGEPAEMCGNGIRCLAKYVYDRGLTSSTEIDVRTRGGLKHLVIGAEEGVAREVTVDMGTPALERKSVPMTGDPASRFVGEPLGVGGKTFIATAVSMGNPHCVLLLAPGEDLATIDVPGLGSEVEHRPEFPNRTNVEFVTVEEGRIRMRVWERGSGETMACGTGACAALVACSLAGLTERETEIRFPGGVLRVAWRDDDHLFLTGPAVCVFEGEVDRAWLAGAAPAPIGAGSASAGSTGSAA
jgi:diaminopimelate epimerase